MSTNSNRAILALSITAALAFPVAAAGHGKGAQHGQKSHGHSADGVTHGGKGKHMRALVVKGTVKAVGDGTIQVTVARANHHGRALRGQDVTFDVSQSRI
ncbi:MAG: hypothetical protein QOD53_601, partial [Thermoleophilaceae bacterium]|nr:hypothetical protein [Thermoleophilaceae bacterium]